MISKLPTKPLETTCIEISKNSEISFAHYFQPDSSVQFAYDIDWIALQETNRAVLLISKKGLYCRAFDTNGGNSWESSTLREWLNSEWIKGSFSYGLENLVIPTPCQSPLDVPSLLPYKMPDDSFRKKSEAEDYVFLLSAEEVAKLLGSQGAEIEPHWIATRTKNRAMRHVKWWTRPSHDSPNNIIDEFGTPSFCNTDSKEVFVRPAVWIDNFYVQRCYMDALMLWEKMLRDVKNQIFDYDEFRKAAAQAHSILYLYSKWADKIVTYPKMVVEMIILIARYSEVHFEDETPEHQLSINAAEALCTQSIHWNTIYKHNPKPGQPGALKNGFIMQGLHNESIVVDAATFDMLNPLDKRALSNEGFFTMF